MNTLLAQQLDFVFNRPVTKPAWYWQVHHEEETPDPFNGEDALTAFDFIAGLCANPGMQLAGYSDDQVGQGLTFIFDGSCSNLTHGFKQAPVAFEHREAALLSLWNLFREVLAPRCAPMLAAGSPVASPPLGYICYMFWDITPLAGQWSGLSKSERRAYYAAVARVMEQCLTVANPAVVESGLHGLGHMVFEYPAVATPILDAFLAKNRQRQDALIQYARAARTGLIQ